MGREVKRVSVGFDWPLNKVWKGFITPEKFESLPCPADCEGGWSWQASYLRKLWYGDRPFTPEMNGSVPHTVKTPAVRERAERNVAHSPRYYGTGEAAILREAQRLADLYNRSWGYHLSQVDVDVLLADGRLRAFTHRFDPTRKGADRWVEIQPPVRPTPAQVNEWRISSFGGSSDYYFLIKARCERYGVPDTCSACGGEGGVEAYPGQREERDAWEWEQPPTGEGWQLWETVSEGSPISPVFTNPEDLAEWMASPLYVWGAHKGTGLSYESALSFVKAGWAPTFIATPSTGVQEGVNAVGEGS